MGTPLEEVSPEQLAELPTDLVDELRARHGDAWVRGVTYAPESHAQAAVRDPCDQTTVDLPALPAPTIIEATSAAGGGTVPAEALEYFVTAVNANGETTASTVAKITPAAEGTVTLTVHKIGSAGVRYRFYRAKGATKKGLRIKGALVTPAGEGASFAFTDTGEPEEAGKEPSATNTTGGPGSYTNLPLVTAVPYLIIVSDQCSTFGFEKRDFKGRALRLLGNAQHAAIEKEFWTGALAQKAGWPNNYLANEETAVELEKGREPSVNRGLQILQDYIANTGFGGQGMIHCQPQTATNLTIVRRVGSLMLDMFDNIVVPGAGYPGTGIAGKAPKAGNAFMFATGLVAARVEEDGTVFPDTFAEALDWGQGGFPNTIRFRAEKYAVAYWDGFIQACIEVKLPT